MLKATLIYIHKFIFAWKFLKQIENTQTISEFLGRKQIWEILKLYFVKNRFQVLRYYKPIRRAIWKYEEERIFFFLYKGSNLIFLNSLGNFAWYLQVPWLFIVAISWPKNTHKSKRYDSKLKRKLQKFPLKKKKWL